jgi:hypothetical protein
MAIEPPGVLQPMRCQVDRDRAALERISRRRQESRDLVSEGRDGTARVPGSDCGGKRNVDEYPDTPTIAPTTVSTTRPEAMDSAPDRPGAKSLDETQLPGASHSSAVRQGRTGRGEPRSKTRRATDGSNFDTAVAARSM